MTETSAPEIVTETECPEQSSLFVGDLSIFCGEEDIMKLFQPFGGLLDVKIMRCDETHKNLCYGFVKYDNQQNAAKAMEALNGSLLCGRPMRISWASHRAGGNRPFNPPLVRMSSDEQFANTSSVHVSYSTAKTDSLITEASLRDVFGEYGEIHDITIKKYEMDPQHHLQRGYGFVHYPATEEGIEAAVRCAKELKDRTVDGIHYKCDISHKLLRLLRNKNGGNREGSNASLTTVEGSSSEAGSTPTVAGYEGFTGHHHRSLPRRGSRNSSSFGSTFGSFRSNSRSSEFFSQSSELVDSSLPTVNVNRAASFDFDSANPSAGYYQGVPSPVDYAQMPPPLFLPVMYPPMMDANGVLYDPTTGQPLVPPRPNLMGYYPYPAAGAAVMYPGMQYQQQAANAPPTATQPDEKSTVAPSEEKTVSSTKTSYGHAPHHQQQQHYAAMLGDVHHGQAPHQAVYASEAQFAAGAKPQYYSGNYHPPTTTQGLPPLPPLVWTGADMNQQQQGGGYVYHGGMPMMPGTLPMPPSLPANYTLASAQMHISRPVMQHCAAENTGLRHNLAMQEIAVPSSAMMCHMVFSPPGSTVAAGQQHAATAWSTRPTVTTTATIAQQGAHSPKAICQH